MYTALTPQEITTANEIMAECEGYVKVIGKKKSAEGCNYLHRHPITGNSYEATHLRYHRDWNWLMPIGKKVSKELRKWLSEGSLPVWLDELELDAMQREITMALMSFEILKLHSIVYQTIQILTNPTKQRIAALQQEMADLWEKYGALKGGLGITNRRADIKSELKKLGVEIEEDYEQLKREGYLLPKGEDIKTFELRNNISAGTL